MPAKQPSLKERLERIWQTRKPEKEGHELTAEGQEVRTPSAGEFLGNLEKASKTERDQTTDGQ